MKEWMELVNYRITEGSDYCWECYGTHAYSLDSWNGDHNGHSFTITFDTKTQEVFEVQAHDYVHQRAYRMINPDYAKKHKKECKRKDVDLNEAWDDVNYVDLDVDDDFIQKCLAIREGEDYDTRVQMSVDFSDEDLLQYMKIAHERDITFNQLVEDALRHAIEEVEAGRLTKQDAKDWLAEKNLPKFPIDYKIVDEESTED
jgi:predicted HicB family RNase H-like nuclease